MYECDVWREEEERHDGNHAETALSSVSSRWVFVHIWLDRSTFSHFSRYSPGGNLLEIFLLPRFLPYRLIRNFYPLIRKRSSKGEREGKSRIRRGVFSTKFFLKTLIQRSSGKIVSRWDCFHLGFLLLFRRLVTFLFFFCFSLPTEKRMNESNLFESGRKYRFVEILISNYLFVSLFVSIVGKYSREIDLLHKKMLLNVFNLFLEIWKSERLERNE